MPALLNKTSRPPVRCTAVATACCAWAMTDTSVLTKTAPGRAAASASPACTSTSAMTTAAPARAKARTAASPMPRAPPVTSTVLPPNSSDPPAGSRPAIGRLHQATDISDGMQPPQAGVAGHVVGLARQGRHMVRPQHALEADIAIGAHAGQHVGWPIIVEGFLKIVRRAAHVAEMDKEYFALVAEVMNGIGQVGGHQPEVALAKRDAVGRAGRQVDELLHGLHAGENPR